MPNYLKNHNFVLKNWITFALRKSVYEKKNSKINKHHCKTVTFFSSVKIKKKKKNLCPQPMQ